MFPVLNKCVGVSILYNKYIIDFHEYLHRHKCVISTSVCVYEFVKEGVFLEDQGMLVGGHRAPEGKCRG